jgi:hypothetical protein
MRDDEKWVKIAVTQSGHALIHASKRLRNDELKNLSPELKNLSTESKFFIFEFE